MSTQLDLTRYDGHTPGPIRLIATGDQSPREKLVPVGPDGVSLLTIVLDNCTTFGAVLNDADARLFADAPLLLAEIAAAREREQKLREAGTMLAEVVEVECATPGFHREDQYDRMLARWRALLAPAHPANETKEESNDP